LQRVIAEAESFGDCGFAQRNGFAEIGGHRRKCKVKECNMQNLEIEIAGDSPAQFTLHSALCTLPSAIP
jgi:hypothetical protein